MFTLFGRKKTQEQQSLSISSSTRYGTFSLSGAQTSQTVNTETMIVMTVRSIIEQIFGYNDHTGMCSLVGKLIKQPELVGLLLSIKEYIGQHPHAGTDGFIRQSWDKIEQIKKAIPTGYSLRTGNLFLDKRLNGELNNELLSQLLQPFADAFELEVYKEHPKSAL